MILLCFLSFGGWCADDKDENPYLQIDLLTLHTVTKVATQPAQSNRIQKYSLSFSYDNIRWFNYTVNGKLQVSELVVSVSFSYILTVVWCEYANRFGN